MQADKINRAAIAWLSGLLLLVVTPLGFWAHSLNLKSRDAEIDKVIRLAFELFDDDQEYIQRYRARETRLKTALSAAPETYHGAAL